MITDEMKRKALVAFEKVVMQDGKIPLPKDVIGAALEAVAADIRNAALEEAYEVVNGHTKTSFGASRLALMIVRDDIRALKTKVTP